MIRLHLVLFVLVITAACSGGDSNELVDGPAEVTGPAMVMFYTDN